MLQLFINLKALADSLTGLFAHGVMNVIIWLQAGVNVVIIPLIFCIVAIVYGASLILENRGVK